MFVLGLSTTQMSCSKYEDGPGISFRSATARISNHWKFTKVTQNSNDISNDFAGYEWKIDEDGTFKVLINSVVTASGVWRMDKDIFVLQYADGEVDIFTIKRLTEKNLKVYLLDVGPHIELATK